MEKRIVVCVKCGALYDLHYIHSVKYHKNKIVKFYCKNCGLVDIIYKNLDHFSPINDLFYFLQKQEKKLENTSNELFKMIKDIKKLKKK